MLEGLDNIRNVVFDFGGVLIDLDKSRCVDNFRRLGCDGVEESLGLSLKSGFMQEYELGNISSAEFCDGVRAHIGRAVGDADIERCWDSFLVGVPAEKLSLILELRKQRNVYLLSNTNDMHWQWSLENVFCRDGHVLDDYFDDVFLSFKLHMAKPDSRMFVHMLDKTGMRDGETLFIDDLRQNCDAAEALGIRTYNAGQHEDLRHLFC